MPLLFAATLFVSASLLFMVQPMVGKMVLPLLGGSPAVWNACMVFFQALLLLGYLYAHHVDRQVRAEEAVGASTWSCSALPLAAFVLAVVLGARHSPIAIAESLAPTGESSPVLSVLALLTVAIGDPVLRGLDQRARCCRSGSPTPATRRPATRTSSTPRATSAA